jgi:hypothetical protein
MIKMADNYWKSLQNDAEAILRRFDRLRERMSVVNAGYTDDEVEKDLDSHGRRRAAEKGSLFSRWLSRAR